jgi:hypothetical protein
VGTDQGAEKFGQLPKNDTGDYEFGQARPDGKIHAMAREVSVGSRRFYIVSEPEGHDWRAQVLEIMDDLGATKDMGIATTGETRTLADDRALGVLQHMLREPEPQP